MSKKLKRPIAFIATLAMILSMLLYLPSGVMTDIGFGLAVSAEDVTGTTSGEGNTPADTGTTGGTGETSDNTDNGEDSTDEPDAVESESVMLLAEDAADFTPTKPTAGDGSSTNPYQISNANELYWFAALVNGTLTDGTAQSTAAWAKLTANITVNNNVLVDGALNTTNSGSFTSWTPIGNYDNQYTGTFDGDNKTISGLYFDNGNTRYVGLFGYVGSGGNVSNVGIVDSYFNGNLHVGGVSGYNNGGTIKNCYNTGAVNGSKNVGGVCGYNLKRQIDLKSTIEDCYNTGAVSGSQIVGGVCGYNQDGTITNCYFDSDNYDGGAVGYTYGGTITYVEGKTTNAFEKGEVCYLLQSGQEKDSGSGEAPMVWGQTIGTDKAPVLTSDSKKTVYLIDGTYINTNSEITEHKHNFGADFRCTNCGDYEAPELNENVYEIKNASQLYWFAEYVNNGNTSAEAILTNDIVVNQKVLGEAGNLVSDTSNFVSWTPIGNSSKQYTGTFNGNGKTISGLYLYNGDKSYVGLFGHVGSSGNVSNVGVVASYFKGKNNVGGVCGYNYGTIQNCYSTGVVSGSENVGGVCGNNNGTIKNCYNTGVVSGSYGIGGGVCGKNYGTITNCYFDSNNYGGGAVGSTDGGTITYVEGKTTNAFEKGEVCYLLQGGQENDSESEEAPKVWGQTIGTDKAPVLTSDSAKTVYRKTTGCATYSNTKSEITEKAHSNFGADADFRCTDCGKYETPVLNKDVYEISNVSQLYWFAEYVKNGNTSAKAILKENIVVNENVLGADGKLVSDTSKFVSWTPIGSVSNEYTGTFDGNGKTISGLYFDNGGTNYVGLFGYVESGGNVSNVGVVASYFNGSNEVGGVCGMNDGGTITNCYNTGAVNGSSYVGGVCGSNDGGTIENCYNTGAVSGGQYFGGVCGGNEGNEGKILNCYNTGAVTGSVDNANHAGGVCGYNNVTIKNCYNTGAVSGSYYVGGVCGYNNYGTITNCYNTGAVNGSEYVGGVCGYNEYGTIENCYNTGAVNGSSYVGGVCGYNYNGTIENCYYLTGTATNAIGYNGGTSEKVESKTDTQFGSGEVAVLLQGEQETAVWGQTLTGENKQDYPVLGGKPVYPCTKGCTVKYANTEKAIGEHTATYSNDGFGTCTDCGKEAYQPATLINGVYEIGNAGQLYWFAQQVNSGNVSLNAVLTDHITVNTGVLNESGNLASNTSGFRSWTPIGNYYNVYQGTFDGNAKTVSGLYFNDTGTNYVSLFGKISGTVKNVGVVDSYFNGQKFVGGVCGNNNGSIENCYNTGTAISYISNGVYSYVGGVCGYNGSGTITSCYNTGTVSGTEYFVGGVCGSNKGIISNCYNAGEVSGTSDNVGGVCGYNLNSITITNCYNIGEVSGIDNVGGVCGYNSKSTITNCYNTGKVSGTGGYVGGMCGKNCSDGIITNCYYLDTTTSDSNATSKTTKEFASGEVAYLLQSGQTAGENGTIPEVWGQTLTDDNKQDFPVLGGAKVYQTTPCPGYSNTANETKAHTDENNDNLCDNCNEKYTFKVETVSSARGGDVSSVANLDGGGNIKNGESTAITASAVPGYTFNGWYNGDTQLSADLSFVYTPTADITLTAKYTANAKMTVNINGGTSYSVSVNGGTASDYSTSTSPSYEVGTKLTVTAKGENFAYWQNEAGSVLSRSAEYTFTVVGKATVTAVYNTKVDSKAIVNFISGYDQIINRYQITAEEDFTVPAAPTKTGCDFAGWSINGGAAVTENVADAVKAAITAALTTESTADDIINVKATYTDKVQSVTVTVTNGTGAGTYNINAVVTVTANAPAESMKFSHWTDGTNTLSYNTSYSFYAAKDITLTAVYVEEAATVEAKGTTEIVDVIKDTVNGKISFVSMSTVPEGCKIQNAGLVATMTAGDFDATNARAVKVGTTSASAYRYTWTVPVSSTDVIYVRAYLVYSDKNGNVHTIYGDIVTGSLNV